jgi:hypothetical protein
MSETLRRIQTLVLDEEVRVSDHGYGELEKDQILVEDAVLGVASAELIEDYRERARGPSVLALQHDRQGRPIHVVWAIAAGKRGPAVLVTAYRPDAKLWDSDFRKRK